MTLVFSSGSFMPFQTSPYIKLGLWYQVSILYIYICIVKNTEMLNIAFFQLFVKKCLPLLFLEGYYLNGLYSMTCKIIIFT